MVDPNWRSKHGGWKGKPRLEIFIRKIAIPENKDECWVWLGALDKNGYGKTGWGIRAHRFSYEVFRSVPPAHLLVCHCCDNPRCVNPSHLWLGTNADNSADRNRKGRQARQHRVRPTISIETAIELRKAMFCGLTIKAAAEKFGVSQGMAANVKLGKTWHFRDEL